MGVFKRDSIDSLKYRHTLPLYTLRAPTPEMVLQPFQAEPRPSYYPHGHPIPCAPVSSHYTRQSIRPLPWRLRSRFAVRRRLRPAFGRLQSAVRGRLSAVRWFAAASTIGGPQLQPAVNPMTRRTMFKDMKLILLINSSIVLILLV
jgi:hypothetical protein